MLSPKIDRDPNWKPGLVPTTLGNALGVSPTSMAKGFGLVGKALGLASQLSGGGGSLPSPPDQPPSPDFASAHQQRRREAEQAPPEEGVDMASLTAAEIARLKERRRKLGMGDFTLLG